MLTIVKELSAEHFEYAHGKGVSLHIKALNQSYLAVTDKLILSQILGNLISNAIKYSPFNKKVEITVIKEQDKISIAIKDEGQGLTDKDKEKLFMKFSRLSARPTAKENSTGLGLYIAQKLAAMLKTKIECKSVENQGATFSVELSI